MKKSFLKLSMMLSCAAFAMAAHATGPSHQQATSSLVNSGSLSNSVRTFSAVSGVGSSFSSATSEGSVKANATSHTAINPVCSGTCGATSGEVKVTGEMATNITGTAFNVSTGGGTGSASTLGNASAALDTKATYTGPGQTVAIFGNGAQSASIGIEATKNTGGFATAGNTGTFSTEGTVGSKVCTGTNNCGGAVVNKEVWGTVADTKSSTSYSNTGAMTVDGVVLNQAPVNATSSAVINAGGSFADPI